MRKDRRPLDPPPVVSLQFYEVGEDGNERPISAECVFSFLYLFLFCFWVWFFGLVLLPVLLYPARSWVG